MNSEDSQQVAISDAQPPSPPQQVSPFVRSVGVTILALGLYFLLFTPTYRSSDDVFMELTSAGRLIATEPDPRLFFSHSWIGAVVVTLNRWLPDWNWYGLYLVAAQCVALLGIAYALQLRERGWSSLALYSTFFVGFGLEFLNKLQFTSASYLCGVGGFAVMTAGFDLARRQRGHCRDKGATCSPGWDGYLLAARVLFGSSLMLLAFLIRWMCVPLILLLCVPLGLARLARDGMDRQNWQLAAVMSAVLMVTWVAWWYDLTDMARGSDWNTGRRRQWQITDLIDYRKLPYDNSTRAVYEQVGWSRADYNLVMNYAIPKEARFGYESLKILSDHHDDQVHQVDRTFTELAGGFLGTIVTIVRTPFSGYCVCVAMVLLVLRRTRRFDRLAVWLTLPLGAVTLLYLLLYKNRVPEWIFLPVAGHMLFSAIFATTAGKYDSSEADAVSDSGQSLLDCSIRKKPLPIVVTRLLWGLVFAGSLWLAHREYLENQQSLEKQKSFLADFMEVANFHPKLLLIHASVPLSRLPATHLSRVTQTTPAVCLGPSMFYPPAQDVLRLAGIRDPLESMATDSEILLLSATTGILKTLQLKWRESQGLDRVFRVVYQGDEFAVYRAQAPLTDPMAN